MARSRLLLFAPGAGAPTSSAWMVAWKTRLERLGRVVPFDYPYQRAGKKSPDRPPVLVSSHRAELARLRAEHEGPIVLIGKSMGGRIGCHVAVELLGENRSPRRVSPDVEDGPKLGHEVLAPAEVVEGERPSAAVCLGYPLVAPGGAVRDEVLLALRTPVLFVQGTRDSMCPLERLAAVRERMQVATELHVVEGGDHSLVVQKGLLAKQGLSQADVDERTLAAIEAFVGQHAT